MIRTILKAMECAVIEAQDGNDGVRRFAAEQADLVICDIIMPNKDGIETILEIRRSAPDVKIIAISGGGVSVGSDYLNAALKLGADHILAKPFQPAELSALVQDLLAMG